ncbi:MAG: non-ribosomal peptide synthetase [Akkermansiaceae bacterium]|nr:non-ribosomal peptide synthetase [Akkermansiaceae bacterium]
MSPSIVNLSPTVSEISSGLTGSISRQASLFPGKTAIRCGGESVTYGELESRSDQLAAAIAADGAGRGDFIGIGLPRSIDLVVAILAVLKAGAAYIPLDPSYPAERIAHMTASAKLTRIISRGDSAGSFNGVRVIPVDAATGNGAVPGEAGADDFIYAIFTSGSTGVPKAASVFHRGFRNLVGWYVDELTLGPEDVTLVISSPSFDLTQKNFFAPLVTGGTMILDHGDHYDIHRISTLVRTHGVTLVNCTPSAFYPLVDAAAASAFGDLSSLRFAVLGGEPISVPRLRGWLTHPSCRAEVVNSYGPTECADICAFHRLHAGNLDAYPFVPTGRDVPNTIVTIRDEDLRELPDGETGELCIGGIGVGGGYLHDPARTAERFTGGIYRSGDLARRLPDGVIEFRGRADHQVKVNGFRIELGEIEIALSTHPGVREAVVLSDGERLIAHVQGEADALILREHLSAKLPAYMIPAEFISTDEFPMTPNGKVDRKALAQPAPEKAAAPANGTGGTLERQILAIWSELLGRSLTDPTANFFDLGGTSIHLAVVHVRLRELTGRDLNITDLFAHPSARALAAHLSPASAGTDLSSTQNRARLQQAGFSRFRRPTQP